MRIGVLGGTFDPIHLGHLVTAEQCREQARLDQVRFIPAARPPHKKEQEVTPFDRRLEMLALAAAGHPAFCIDELEKQRPGPSYTVDTLDELQRRFPGSELFLIIGSDCLPDLPGWREPVRILTLASLLIVNRPSWPIWPAEKLRQALQLTEPSLLRHQVVEVPFIDIASRDLRQRVREGRSIRYLVPHAVETYIQEKRLYV